MKRLILTVLMMFGFATTAHAKVTEQQVMDAQKAWGEAIVKIGKTFSDKGDYKQTASDVIKELYAYQFSPVLFKPTLASEDKFRETHEEALSYFVTGIVAEDKGFAIKPWSKVRFGDQQIVTYENAAKASGLYYFTPAAGGDEVEVEYSFGYIKDDKGNLRINLHHSSLPYSK